MNDKFFKLPTEKQQRIINAAYKVFSKNSYKKASMSEIAAEGGISKSLLFHYFTNKKELYLYLWTTAMKMTQKAISNYSVLKTSDFFEMLKRSLLAKCSLMREYPHIGAFSLNAYYEEDSEIFYAMDGYMLQKYRSGEIVPDEIEQEIDRLIDLWKVIYTEKRE